MYIDDMTASQIGKKRGEGEERERERRGRGRGEGEGEGEEKGEGRKGEGRREKGEGREKERRRRREGGWKKVLPSYTVCRSFICKIKRMTERDQEDAERCQGWTGGKVNKLVGDRQNVSY